MKTTLLTPDKAIALAQQNVAGSHLITILAYLGQVDVPATFGQVGGGGVTRPDGLSFSQWSNEKGELLILFAGLGLFSYQLNTPETGEDDWLPEYPPEDEPTPHEPTPHDDPHDYGPYDYEDEPNSEQDALGDLHASQHE